MEPNGLEPSNSLQLYDFHWSMYRGRSESKNSNYPECQNLSKSNYW
jgi:hypothetical protein